MEQFARLDMLGAWARSADAAGESTLVEVAGRWAARPGDYSWYDWVDEGVTGMFDGGSGETHLLSILPAAALRALCAAPMHFAALAERLTDEGVIGSTDEWLALLRQSVDGLWGLQLIAPADARDGTGA